MCRFIIFHHSRLAEIVINSSRNMKVTLRWLNTSLTLSLSRRSVVSWTMPLCFCPIDTCARKSDHCCHITICVECYLLRTTTNSHTHPCLAKVKYQPITYFNTSSESKSHDSYLLKIMIVVSSVEPFLRASSIIAWAASESEPLDDSAFSI